MSRPRERGFGLLIVVVALAVLGGLALGAFAAGRREQRNARDLAYAAQAFEAAEAGLAAAAAAAPGFATAPIRVPLPGPGSVGYTTTVLRLNPTLFLVASEGWRLDAGGRPLARRVSGMVGRLVTTPDLAATAFTPLRARGWVQLYR